VLHVAACKHEALAGMGEATALLVCRANGLAPNMVSSARI